MRLARLLIAVLVVTQASAHAKAWLVCRHTGNVVAPCPCPMAREAESGGDAVRGERCCELRTIDVKAMPGQVEGAPQSPPRTLVLAWVPPESPLRIKVGAARFAISAWPLGPPPSPIYLATRSLLI